MFGTTGAQSCLARRHVPRAVDVSSTTQCTSHHCRRQLSKALSLSRDSDSFVICPPAEWMKTGDCTHWHQRHTTSRHVSHHTPCVARHALHTLSPLPPAVCEAHGAVDRGESFSTAVASCSDYIQWLLQFSLTAAPIARTTQLSCWEAAERPRNAHLGRNMYRISVQELAHVYCLRSACNLRSAHAAWSRPI